MTGSKSTIDRISLELHQLTTEYARKAEALASDPYFREAILKVSVSGFVWALYEAFSDPMDRLALDAELKEQSGAISRAVGGLR